MKDSGLGYFLIATIAKLIGVLSIIAFSAWLIHIEHPGYLWISVLILFVVDSNIKITCTDKKEDTKEEEDNAESR